MTCNRNVFSPLLDNFSYNNNNHSPVEITLVTRSIAFSFNLFIFFLEQEGIMGWEVGLGWEFGGEGWRE